MCEGGEVRRRCGEEESENENNVTGEVRKPKAKELQETSVGESYRVFRSCLILVLITIGQLNRLEICHRDTSVWHRQKQELDSHFWSPVVISMS